MYIAWQALDEFCENSVECEDEDGMAYMFCMWNTYV